MLMDCFDIHTHRLPLHPSQAIVSVDASSLPVDGKIVHASVGIHPWHLTETNVEVQWKAFQAAIEEDRRIVAIGEAGLDKLKGASLEAQTAVFRQEIALAETLCLPMVIHCVRAFNELLKLKKEVRPCQPWVIHGFRGKESVARELLRHGCYLSFGERFQSDALRAVPLDRLFIETDESSVSIETIGLRIAEARGEAPEELAAAIDKNVRKVFFRL